MAELLETVMLVCFGASWPINLIKSIRSGTARSTSLVFLLLIFFGYIAGLSAKLVSKTYNYVLIVYVFNLLSVSANLVVYMINRAKDKKQEQAE